MWPDLVVVPVPVLAEVACLADGAKAVLVEQLVADAAVETLRVGVLRRLAGADVVHFDPALVRPSIECAAREFGAVVGADPPPSRRSLRG